MRIQEKLYTKESWVSPEEDLIVRHVMEEKGATSDTTNVMKDRRWETGYPKSVNATKPVWKSNIRKRHKRNQGHAIC
jgi:hypothetical protein